MLRKFLLIGVFTLCATLYAYGPEWSSVSAQGSNQSVPGMVDVSPATPLGGILSDLSQGNFTPGVPLTLNVDYTNDSDDILGTPTFSVALPEGITPAEGSGWEQRGDGPDGDGITVYTLSPEDSSGAVGVSLRPGETASAPLLVDIAETVGTEPINIATRFDAYDASQEAGSRLSAIADAMEILPTVAFPQDITLGDATIPTTSEEIQFDEAAVGSTPPTLNTDTGEVSIPIRFTNTSGETLEDTLLVVEVPEDTTVPEGSGWTLETITDADGNEKLVAVLNVGSLAPGQPVTAPFPFTGNNLNIGQTIDVPTLLTANNGAVTLSGNVTATLEEALVPLNLTETNEPSSDLSLYLPIIRQ